MKDRLDIPSPAQAEAEADAARARLAETLGQLRENLKPGNLAEEVIWTARTSAASLSGRAVDAARTSPLSTMALDAGLSILRGMRKRTASPIEATALPARSAAASATLGHGRDEEARSTVDSADDGAAPVGAAPGGRLASATSRLAAESPLMVAAIGVAVGAAIGAMLPLATRGGDVSGETGPLLPDSAPTLAMGPPSAAHDGSANSTRPKTPES